jgi:hypothetical protein
MDRDTARAVLGLPPIFTHADVEAAFRSKARTAHPDTGGTTAEFLTLTESRARLLQTRNIANPVRIINKPKPLQRLKTRIRARRDPKQPRVQ